MKLIRAKFENFRLLRSLELDFSTDKNQRLTVIRAENESGKTTILNGLQWALYGDDALPGKGQGYRLHPIDWDVSDGKPVPVSAQVEFETTSLWRTKKREMIESRRKYRIIRSTSETVDGDRSPSTVRLFRLENTGSVEMDLPDAFIKEALPLELREIFFTDGDRVLSFVEATVAPSTKRKHVEKAILSLLSLGVIKDALKRVKKAESEVNKAVKGMGSSDKLREIAIKLERVEESLSTLEEKIVDSREQFAAFDEKLAEIQKKIDAALVKGDREKLKRDIEKVEGQLKKTYGRQDVAEKEHAALFQGLPLARDLVAPMLEKALDKLSGLKEQGRIPNIAIPVLEEQLRGEFCICGEPLDGGSPDGQRRRGHIQHLVDKSRHADELQSTITDLYYASRPLQPGETPQDKRWLAEYKKVCDRREELESMREEQGERLKALEAQLDSVPDTDIQILRDTRREYVEQRDRFNADCARYETQLKVLKKVQEKLVQQRANLLREKEKSARIFAELEVIQDVEKVLQNSHDRIMSKELVKVSELMNSIFLEMIGADPEQKAIIRKAEISMDYDIMVYGPSDRTLNPDRDLNGASRRALTLAFILALTKVSEVEAANVIDTPLGMMSGYVKRSVLKTAIRESSQLVLFLTRSEIADCEEILDAEAGRIITLTNSAHYPRMLVNDPQVNQRTVLRCECGHRKECRLCQRRQDIEAENGTCVMRSGA